jgi:Beta galactosidase small chain
MVDMEPFEEHARGTFASETNRIHLVLFGVWNRTSGPYLAANNRILISLMDVTHRFSMASLAKARHDYELVADDRIHVHLDARHMGVGGDDSWSPSVHEVIPAARPRSQSSVQLHGSDEFCAYSQLVFWWLCSPSAIVVNHCVQGVCVCGVNEGISGAPGRLRLEAGPDAS